ncbi:MAG: phosphoesterase [Minisyncoccia bacterium]
MKKVVAIYHKDCSDGTTAAAVILKKFPEAKVFPLHHSYTPEELQPIISLIDNEVDFYTVDCVMGVKEVLALGFKVTSIDHHGGVKEEFENLAKENPNYTFIFDSNKSGASLAWSYFFPDEEVPELIKYVEDVDLWKNKLGENTKFVARYLVSLNDKPEETLKSLNSDIGEILTEGKIISNYADFTVEDEAQLKPIKIKIGDNLVNAYNTSSINSSVLGSIHNKSTGQTFVCYRINGESVKYSFRSTDECTPSALDLASQIGGNGHRNSAGARTTLKKFLEMIVLE